MSVKKKKKLKKKKKDIIFLFLSFFLSVSYCDYVSIKNLIKNLLNEIFLMISTIVFRSFETTPLDSTP